MTSRWTPAGDRTIRVGLIGLGSMGRNHLRLLHAMAGADLVAVADVDATALAAASATTGAQGFREPLALLEEAELDAVVIAAPTTSHLALTSAAIERGIVPLVEKPLAATPVEAATIVDAAAARGSPSRSATSNGSTRPSSSSAGCSPRAGCRRSTRSRVAAPARSRHASATSG